LRDAAALGYSWALLFPTDFKSLTLIDAGIPGVTLTNEILLSDYERKWNFVFQLLPDPLLHPRPGRLSHRSWTDDVYNDAVCSLPVTGR
jgi:hypothetical protein